MKETIEITVNGTIEIVPSGISIADLIQRFGEEDPNVIVEHSSQCGFVQEYASRTGSRVDRIEFINPNFGG